MRDRLLPPALYVALAIVAIVLVNADAEASLAGLAIVAAGSLALGWMVGEWWAIALAAILVPLALPFGYADSDFGDDPLVWTFAIGAALLSAALILVSVALRRYARGEPRQR